MRNLCRSSIAENSSSASGLMRPLGALAGGLAAEYGGLETAIALPVLLFALSTLAILASPMPRLKAMPEGELTPLAAG